MKFKCIHTGEIYEFLQENDIEEMLKHDEYEAIEEPKEPKKPKKLKE